MVIAETAGETTFLLAHSDIQATSRTPRGIGLLLLLCETKRMHETPEGGFDLSKSSSGDKSYGPRQCEQGVAKKRNAFCPTYPTPTPYLKKMTRPQPRQDPRRTQPHTARSFPCPAFNQIRPKVSGFWGFDYVLAFIFLLPAATTMWGTTNGTT